MLKRTAALLRDAGIDFALGGGLSAWARGGPPTENDIDLMVRERDAEPALEVLEEAGMRIDRPPEGWLVKAHDGDVLIDLMFAPAGVTIDDEFFARCDDRSVAAVHMRVMPVNDLIVSKLLALTEHHLDMAPILEHTRALREQIDWTEVQRRTAASPFARAFISMIHDMGVAEAQGLHVDPTPTTWSRAG